MECGARRTALELASRGANVAVNDFANAADADDVVTQIKEMGRKAIAIQADVGNVEQIRAMFRTTIDYFDCKSRGLDIVVSNAGINSFSHLRDTEEEEFDRVFGVNTKGQYFVAQEAFRNGTANGKGRIILLSSRTAQGRGFACHAIYAGSKGAIETFVRCMAVDCADKKMTINAIAPGPTMTDQMKHLPHYIPGGDKMTQEELLQITANGHPFKRIGQPEDIARAVAFLASEDGGWVNGHVLAVDGGMLR